MVLKNFDNRFAIVGTRKIYLSNGSLSSSSQLTDLYGGFGSQDTISHPHPYVTGGPWTLNRTVTDYGRVTGTGPYPGGSTVVYDNYRVAAAVANGNYAVILGARSINDVLADTNPSRPVVDLPVFFNELRELPELIFHYGKKLPRNVANANLQYQFGWKLLLSDLASLFNFQRQTYNRALELSALYHTGGARFNRVLGTAEWRDSTPVSVGSLGSNLGTLYKQRASSARRWCSVSWKPDLDPAASIPSINSRYYRAFRACYGIGVDPYTLWSALPWSWLFDWFTDTGSFLLAHRNTVGFSPGQSYSMQTDQRYTYHYVLGNNAAFSVIPPFYSAETKSRSLAAGLTLSATVPFLSKRQIGILASLYVLNR